MRVPLTCSPIFQLVDDFLQDVSVWLRGMVEARRINENNTFHRVFVMLDDKIFDIRCARVQIIAHFSQR
jgi:hypothetical protein